MNVCMYVCMYVCMDEWMHEWPEIDLGNGQTEVFPKPAQRAHRDVDALDYRHWDRWALVPDDPVSLEDLRKKKEVCV